MHASELRLVTRETLQKPARIVIVDDHPLLREALSLTISSESDLDVCGEADSEYQAFELVKQVSPDLVLVDISLEDGNGIELVKQLNQSCPAIKTLVISTYPESLYAERALRAGAMGYINKQEPKELVITAIRAVLSGERYISSETTQRLIGQVLEGNQPSTSPIDALSDRELEVFQLIGEGLTGVAVAERLGVSIHTIDSYRARLKKKLGLQNGVELQREAVRWVTENE